MRGKGSTRTRIDLTRNSRKIRGKTKVGRSAPELISSTTQQEWVSPLRVCGAPADQPRKQAGNWASTSAPWIPATMGLSGPPPARPPQDGDLARSIIPPLPTPPSHRQRLEEVGGDHGELA